MRAAAGADARAGGPFGTPFVPPPLHVNILIASMAKGGAERSVHDVVAGLRRGGATGKLLLMHDLEPSYPVEGTGAFPVVRLGALDRATRLRRVAQEVLTSPSRLVYTHLIGAADLRVLWEHGVATVPVVQNSAPAWQDAPAAFAHEGVPFVASVSDGVRRQLVAAGCPKPVVVVRHELQRWPDPGQAARDREEIRRRHGVGPDSLLIGMVGQFKRQKAYPRAVQVLAQARRFTPAKLMILGGWDHDYGDGRAAHADTVALAAELGVARDLLLPGAGLEVEPCYAAFDLFLNTSDYEGLSVATLEAAQAGCPIVTADVGGQGEAAPPGAALVADPADVPAYVAAVRTVVERARPRSVRPPPAMPDLVPRLWGLLARHGGPDGARPSPGAADTLFLTDDLAPGGPAQPLAGLLAGLRGRHRAWACALDDCGDDRLARALGKAGVPTVCLAPAATALERAERALELASRLGAAAVCFWNVAAPVKLLAAKVLAHRAVRLVDVSPGPGFFDRLDEAGEFQRRIAFSAAEYLARLDCLAAAPGSGTVPARYGARPRRTAEMPPGLFAAPGGDAAAVEACLAVLRAEGG